MTDLFLRDERVLLIVKCVLLLFFFLKLILFCSYWRLIKLWLSLNKWNLFVWKQKWVRLIDAKQRYGGEHVFCCASCFFFFFFFFIFRKPKKKCKKIINLEKKITKTINISRSCHVIQQILTRSLRQRFSAKNDKLLKKCKIKLADYQKDLKLNWDNWNV